VAIIRIIARIVVIIALLDGEDVEIESRNQTINQRRPWCGLKKGEGKIVLRGEMEPIEPRRHFY
jgi:hypothetical protein